MGPAIYKDSPKISKSKSWKGYLKRLKVPQTHGGLVPFGRSILLRLFTSKSSIRLITLAVERLLGVKICYFWVKCCPHVHTIGIFTRHLNSWFAFTKTNQLQRNSVLRSYRWLGTVKNHGKKVQKTRHTFKKITKNTAKTRHQNAMYF